jgi:hypothetical protein
LRTDHFSNARAARSCAPLIGGLEFKFPAKCLFLAVKPYALAPAVWTDAIIPSRNFHTDLRSSLVVLLP